jgi:site-specific DNA-methyltransferase (adenine-specific)
VERNSLFSEKAEMELIASDKVFFGNPKIRIINDDGITTKEVNEKPIDLIVTSPPYNVDIQYNSHNDKISYEEYLEFSKKWMARCFEWLKDYGRFCLIKNS